MAGIPASGHLLATLRFFTKSGKVKKKKKKKSGNSLLSFLICYCSSLVIVEFLVERTLLRKFPLANCSIWYMLYIWYIVGIWPDSGMTTASINARKELLSVCIHSQGFPTSLSLNQTRTKLFFSFRFISESGARFSKVPVNFQARKQIFKTKYKE